MQFIDLKAQYQFLQSKIDQRIQQVLSHGKYIMGPEVYELESRLAEYVGVKHCISCANGTDALQLALMALDIKQGDVVFVPTFTFFASAEVISLVGATPVFVDVDPVTFNLCPTSLEEAIHKVKLSNLHTPKAIISVDLFGLPANYPEICTLARKHGLKVIEDAAQGFGGKIATQYAGSFGDIATTSFFPAKPLGCYGDGGALFTNNTDYADKLKSLRVHGKGNDKYDNVRIGLNSRLDTIQAAVLLEKLAIFDAELIRRNEIAQYYQEHLKGGQPACVPSNYYSSWAQFTLKSDKRSFYQAKLKQAGIPSMIYYQTCMHQQTAFQHLNHYVDLSCSEQLSDIVFSLPMHPYLSDSDLVKIVTTLLS